MSSLFGGGLSSSTSFIQRPFGTFPNSLAQRARRAQIGPLTTLFGLGAGQGFERMSNRLERGQGPLAGVIQGVQGFAPDVLPTARTVGADIASRTPAAFEDLSAQIRGALGALPGFQATLGGEISNLQGASGRARDLVDQAFSPIASRALFQETLGRAQEPLTQSLASQGLLGQGGGAALQRDLSTDLASQFALRDQQNQMNALATQANLSGALQNLVGGAQALSTAGIPIANQQFDALNALAQGLLAGQNIPMAQANAILQLLTGSLSPALQLTGLTAPMLGQRSSSFQLG